MDTSEYKHENQLLNSLKAVFWDFGNLESRGQSN